MSHPTGHASTAKFQPKLKGDLDNIILKALRKEPERRYASAEQLAEDIRKHLAGLPVSAAPDSFVYRSNKFVRRHQFGVAAIFLIVVVVAGGVFTTLRQARIAAINQQRAEKRFADVRKLANSLLFEINDSIADLPGSIPARKLLVERALQYLDSLAQESSGDPSLQRELSAAYERVGDVQGYPFRANLGDTQGALNSYRRALAIDEALVKNNSDDIASALHLAAINRRLAETDSVSQNMVGALAEGKRAVEIGENSSARFPQDKKVLQGMFQDYQVLAGIEGGNPSANLGDTAGALALHQKATAIAETLCADEPANTTFRRMLAGEVIRLGDQLAFTGSWQSAQKPYLRALEILQSLATPNNATSQADLGDAYSHLGDAQIANGDLVSAKESFGKDLEIYGGIYQADHTNVLARLNVFLAYMNLGDVESKSGEMKQALASEQTAQTIAEQVSSINPTAVVRTDQGLVHIVAGEVLSRAGNIDAALQHYEDAIAIYTRLNNEDPANADSRLYLAAAYNRLGEGLLRKKNSSRAIEAFRSAINLTQPDASDSLAVQLYVIADSDTGLGDAMAMQASDSSLPQAVQITRWRAAQSFYQESMKTWRKVREPGIESPNGFDCVPPTEVAQRIEHSQQALQQLGVIESGQQTQPTTIKQQ